MSSNDQEHFDPDELSIPAFSPIVDTGAGFLSGLSDPESVPSGTLLLGQNQSPDTVQLIREGIVKLTFTNRNGDETVLGLRSEGWWLGATLALLNLPSLCAIRAITRCSVSTMPAGTFSLEIMKNHRMLRHVLSGICRELLMVQQHGIMQGSSASERLRYLQGESSQSIWKTVDPTLVMRQNEVAKLLSITPEHLSRITRTRDSDN